MLREGDAFRIVAMHGELPPEYVEERRSRPVLPVTPGTGMSHLIAAKRPIQIPDLREEPAYSSGPARALIEIAGARTLSPFQCSKKTSWSEHQYLSPGGLPVFRQADRAVHELRRAGRHCDREHPPAQRAARVAAAADRHLRGAQVISSSPGELEPCSKPCSRMRCEFARPGSACSFVTAMARFIRRLR